MNFIFIKQFNVYGYEKIKEEKTEDMLGFQNTSTL